MQWFWQQFIGGHEGRDDPRLAPLHASVAGCCRRTSSPPS
jgi:hypothetical protein